MNGYTELDEMPRNTPNRGATVVWRNVNVYAKDKKSGRGRAYSKQIINNSTGFIQPGTLMAVMGSRLAKYASCHFWFIPIFFFCFCIFQWSWQKYTYVGISLSKHGFVLFVSSTFCDIFLYKYRN